MTRGARFVAAILAVGLGIGLAGCGSPPGGADGDLLNNWAVMAAPELPMPKADTCFILNADEPEDYGWRATLDCTDSHNLETFKVGAVTGADAQRSIPPTAGSPGRRKAYEDCAGAAKEFLGDDWRAGRVYLYVVLPNQKHWAGGARWVRCDLVEVTPEDDGDLVRRTTSLKGALTGAAPLRMGCFTVKDGAGNEIESMLPIDCGQAHQAEFVGTMEGPDVPFPSEDKAQTQMFQGKCLAMIGAYAGLPNDSNLKYRTGWITHGYNKEDWDRGNRGVNCFFYREKSISRSVKGAGTGALPIQYA